MEAQEYIDQIAGKRGAVTQFHRVMAQHDFPVLTATDGLTRAAVLEERSLERPTKQLVFIVALAALHGDREDLAHHIKLALTMGLTAQQVLEALEILIPLGGVVLYKEAFSVWCEATDAKGLEPSV